MTVDAVLVAAAERTGLSDFGDRDFKARMRRLLSEIDQSPTATAYAKAQLFNECVRNAANRLRNREFVNGHPEVEALRIERPIVIVGLPRSGTTHLLNLISADRRLRSMPLWESYQPVPDADAAPIGDGEDQRLVRLRSQLAARPDVVPLRRLMHTQDPEHIHEEIELMAPEFTTYIYEWGGRRMPRWRDFYLACDQTPHYAYMRTMLKVLQWHRAGERWILKSPQHLEQLGPLMDAFPDAFVVFTHRDPVAVVQSAAMMSAYASRMNYTDADPGYHLRYWFERIRRLLLQSLRDRHLVPAGQAMDVAFDEFMADELGTALRIYEAAGLKMTPAALGQMKDYLEANAQERRTIVRIDLRSDFGAEPDEMRREFDFYLDRIAVRPEVK